MHCLAVFFTLVALSQAAVFNRATKLDTVRNETNNLGIHHGQEAALNQFPYQVGIFIQATSIFKGFCGGSLISQKYVLTAAHCVEQKYLNYTLLIGANTYDNPENTSVTLRSNKVTLHPDYQGVTDQAHDIAVVELPEQVELSDAIQLVKLPARSEVGNLFINEMATISGWGLTSSVSKHLSSKLRYASNPIMSNSDCANHSFFVPVPDSNMCLANTVFVGALRGDSGGPLTVTMDGAVKQVGVIISEGTLLPNRAARLTSFLDFIEQNTDVVIDS